MNPEVTAFFHRPTWSVSYVVAEPGGGRCCAIVDSVLDYDPKAGRTATGFADRVADFVRGRGLEVVWHLETHAHADHFTAAPYLKEKLGGRIATGVYVTEVQKLWKAIYNLPDFPADGSQYDHLFRDGDRLQIGRLEGQVLHTPGHTPANVTYVIGDAAFVNDTILMPDFGTARADFPGGDARQLYRSIRKILALPPETRLFVGHDYMPGGREPAWEASVAEQRAKNVHLKGDCPEDAFVALREGRDATLEMPKLILHVVQVNMNAGRLPPPEANGTSYLRIPLNRL